MKEDAIKQALDFESSMAYMVKKSNTRAWSVAIISLVVALLSMGAVFALAPLKTTEPYVIRVNETTGMVDIITTIKEKGISTSEAIDKYFVNRYIMLREGYYYEMLNNDFKAVQNLSSPEVAKAYVALYTGENSRDKELKNNYIIEPSITSLSLADSNGAKTATARVSINVISRANNTISKTEDATITLSYKYFKEPAKEADRLENPLGFKVINYRIDEVIEK